MSSVIKSGYPLLIPDPNSSVPYGSDPKPANDKIQEAVKSRPIFRNICNVTEGLFKSRIFRTLLNMALMGLAIGLLFVLFSNPVGWIATVAGVSLLAAKLILSAGAIAGFALMGFLAQFPRSGTVEFELSAIRKLIKSKNYDEIPVDSDHRLYLGAIPNALKDYKTMQKVVGKNGTVIAIMEDWELSPQGLSIPMTKEDYVELGILCRSFSARDHKIMKSEDLDKLADAIHQGLQDGNVYVHCRGGVGRSATAVAAYLMKYEGKSIVEACAWIKGHRWKSTIWNKLSGLRNYQKHIRKNYKIELDPLPTVVNTTADTLEKIENARKRPKLSNNTILAFQAKYYHAPKNDLT